MILDPLPISLLFAGSVVLILAAISAGFRLGRRIHGRSAEEKDASAPAISGSVLSLVAFMLAFTFGIVAERNSARKGLVREEANAIRTSWLRSDFLPEPDRARSVRLLGEYLDGRLEGVRLVHSGERSLDHLTRVRHDAERLQLQLWKMAVTEARDERDSPALALYLESLNQVANLHALRISIGLQARIPTVIWGVLGSLTFCGMAAMGFQTGIAGSKPSWSRPLLAVAFSMVVVLIVSLDRPGGGVLKASQQPLIDLREQMATSPPR